MSEKAESLKDELSVMRVVLEDYLFKVKKSATKKLQLQNRICMIVENFSDPINAVGYSAMPRNPSPDNSGAASFTLKLAEIEERLYKQQDNIAKALVEIMDIVELLPDGEERQILELKYIDRLSSAQIEKQMYLSRTACYNKKIAGLNRLLGFKKVQAIVKKHKQEMEMEGYQFKEWNEEKRKVV